MYCSPPVFTLQSSYQDVTSCGWSDLWVEAKTSFEEFDSRDWSQFPDQIRPALWRPWPVLKRKNLFVC
jgi:hypothetical protein